MTEKQESHCDHSHDLIPTRVFKIGITLNLLFVVVEILYGISSQSLALISDAFHNLADVFGLALAWMGVLLATSTRGKKFSIYAAVFNSGLLLMSSLWVMKESFERYTSPIQPQALTMIIVAFIGFVINLASAKLFHKDHHHDLNVRSAYLHLMADAGISLGVVFTGIIIYFKAAYWVDPVISFVISIVIIYITWPLFQEAQRMVRGKTPKHINIEKVQMMIEQTTMLKAEQIKIMAISTAEFSLDVKLNHKLTDDEYLKLQNKLKHDYKITKITLS